MPDSAYAILIEPSTDLQRDQVQELIKTSTENWWHGMPDVWIVLGKKAGEWKDLVRPIFPTEESGKVLVLKIDNAPNISSWAYRAFFPDSTRKWLHDNL